MKINISLHIMVEKLPNELPCQPIYIYIFIITQVIQKWNKTQSIFISQRIHNTIKIIHTLIQTFKILNKMHSITDSYLNQNILYKIRKIIYFTLNKRSYKKIGTGDHVTPTSKSSSLWFNWKLEIASLTWVWAGFY